MSAVPVLEVVVSTSPGGGPTQVLALAPRLRALGFEPIVAGPMNGALAPAFRDDGIEVVDVRTDRLAPGAIGTLVQLIRARGVRLVHTHGKGAGLHGRLAARAAGVPVVHTFHGVHFESYRAPTRALYLALERGLGRMTAAFVCVSSAEHAEATRLRLIPPGRGRIVPNGVDVAALEAAALDRIAARRMLGLDPDAVVIGTVARLDPVKGIDVLARAMAHLSDVQLVVIGAGSERSRLERLAPPSRARFVGEIVGAARLLHAFDVCVTASAKEGMPIGVLEAMALGCPVVASDIPAHREALGGDYPALAPRAPAEFAKVVAEVIGNLDLAGALGRRNRHRVADFDVAVMVESTARIYRELLL